MDKVEDIVGRLRGDDDLSARIEAADLIQSQQALIEEMREALVPFGKIYEGHLEEHFLASSVGGYVPLDDGYPIDSVELRYFRAASEALSQKE